MNDLRKFTGTLFALWALLLAPLTTDATRLGQSLRGQDVKANQRAKRKTRRYRRQWLEQAQPKLHNDWKTVGNNTQLFGSQVKTERKLAKELEKPPEEDNRIVIVELSETPLFHCPTCDSAVKLQQENVWKSILQQYPNAEFVSNNKRLVNALYVRLPESAYNQDDDDSEDDIDNNNIGGDDGLDHIRVALMQIEGVTEVHQHHFLSMDSTTTQDALEYIGGYEARQDFCTSGKGVRVAVLDGGIDYTHFAIGGPGTRSAFREAYGSGPQSFANRERDDLFPTKVVVDGYDFIGDVNGYLLPNEDPIDAFGHGTAVAHAILTVAPNVELVAIKVCGLAMYCPSWSIINGLEFAMDADNDNIPDDNVDIINLSLGISFISSSYNFIANALDTVFDLGTLPVVSAGNSGNIPYVIGGLSGSPNSLVVGATGSPTIGENDGLDFGVVAPYSSRGPAGMNWMKPDIVGPSGLALAAAGSGNKLYGRIYGTSFSAPIVSGAAALVMERCPSCSPFAIKSLLMNTAERTTQYVLNSTTGELAPSPITLSGAGEINVHKALDSDLWMYSVDDVQPSISLGLINAASDVILRRTIKVINLSERAQTLQTSFAFRYPDRRYGDAMEVEVTPSVVELPGGCDSEATVEVVFTIDASKAPPNHLTSSGVSGFNPRRLDIHEFGGHVVLTEEETGKDSSLPFLAIIRQASNVTVENALVPELDEIDEPTDVPISITNNGAGRAQIDAFQLVAISADVDVDRESRESAAPNDFRYIGYRVVPGGQRGCSHVLEFAFTTWERKFGRLVYELYGVDFDIDGDGKEDFFIYNRGLAKEILLLDISTNETSCTGFSPDHGTTSTNTILRVCSDSLGIEAEYDGDIGVRFQAANMNIRGELVGTDGTDVDFIPIGFPKARISAASYNLEQGESLKSLRVDGTGKTSSLPSTTEMPAALMITTNAYRNLTRTGASLPKKEAFLVLQDTFNTNILPDEDEPDGIEVSTANDLTGPDCSWQDVAGVCDEEYQVPLLDGTEDGEGSVLEGSLGMPEEMDEEGSEAERPRDPTFVFFCPIREVPRPDVIKNPPVLSPVASNSDNNNPGPIIAIPVLPPTIEKPGTPVSIPVVTSREGVASISGHHDGPWW